MVSARQVTMGQKIHARQRKVFSAGVIALWAHTFFCTFFAVKRQTRIYWWAQIFGWLLYYCSIILYNFFGGSINWLAIKSGIIIVVVGMAISHGFRYVIIRWNWLKLSVTKIIPRIFLASLLLGILYYVIHGALSLLLLPEVDAYFTNDWSVTAQVIINWTFLMLFWSLIYFTSNFFLHYKNQEIKNLRLQATNREIVLNQLKSQLNPHFTFNALNSIRALIDEDPPMAKKAITRLSHLLRAALNTDVKRTVAMREELEFVRSYMELESIRFEDRLRYYIDVDPEVLSCSIPPLLIQTLVENAVKHGISKLTDGGEIRLKAKAKGAFFEVCIENSGYYDPPKKRKKRGLGLWNTRRRLGLMYGNDAKIFLRNENNKVITELIIPNTP